MNFVFLVLKLLKDETALIKKGLMVNNMTKERLLYIAGRALGELIYHEEGCDPEEMKEWCKNEFELTDEELEELDVE